MIPSTLTGVARAVPAPDKPKSNKAAPDLKGVQWASESNSTTQNGVVVDVSNNAGGSTHASSMTTSQQYEALRNGKSVVGVAETSRNYSAQRTGGGSDLYGSLASGESIEMVLEEQKSSLQSDLLGKSRRESKTQGETRRFSDLFTDSGKLPF